MDELRKRQEELEMGSVEAGVAYFRKKQASRLPAETKSGQDFLRGAFEALSNAIREEQEAIANAARRPKLLKHDIPLLSVESDKLALITLRGILNLIALKTGDQAERKLSSVARETGTMSYLERNFDVQRGREKKIEQLLAGRNRNPWNAERRARKLALLADDSWYADDRGIRLGLELTNLAIEHVLIEGTAAFEVTGTKAAVLSLTSAAKTWLNDRDLHHDRWARPVYLPMMVPPLASKSAKGGGYLTARHLELVKRDRGQIRKDLQSVDSNCVLQAVNALQETRWQINTAIYRTMHDAWKHSFPFPGETTFQPLPLPPRLPDDTPPERIKEHKAQRARAHHYNSVAASNRQIMEIRLQWCQKLLNQAPLYFPYQLDTRGRAYPIPQIFHPQADDIGRSLLYFHDAKPLGERGVFWLGIHLANSFGFDKTSFADRFQWVIEHDKEIVESAADPLRVGRLWLTADRPWCFLAACFEWASYRSVGTSFRSKIPVTMDGTCNGLQHLSALARDPVGARATNLVPTSTPQDIYRDVAVLAGERVKLDREAGLLEALALPIVDRRLVKRATMTTPYGVTRRGVREQLIREGFSNTGLTGTERWRCATYFADVLQESIAAVLDKGIELMKWLKALTRTLARSDRPLHWTLPTGFVASHEYRMRKQRRIVTTERTLVIYEDDAEARINVRKQVNAIVPNLIHSLDAAHMMLTVVHLAESGLCHFAMVHDSYGVHACDIDCMNVALREEFVRVYREPVLVNFFEEQCRANPGMRGSLPMPPPSGCLNIEDVLASEYFFS
jgi:DNA-directed RNA polymerase